MIRNSTKSGAQGQGTESGTRRAEHGERSTESGARRAEHGERSTGRGARRAESGARGAKGKAQQR